jgi:hypothetical protein
VKRAPGRNAPQAPRPHTNNPDYRYGPRIEPNPRLIEVDGALVADAALMAKAGEKLK